MSSLFQDLKEGLEEAISYEKGTGPAKKHDSYNVNQNKAFEDVMYMLYVIDKVGEEMFPDLLREYYSEQQYCDFAPDLTLIEFCGNDPRFKSQLTFVTEMNDIDTGEEIRMEDLQVYLDLIDDDKTLLRGFITYLLDREISDLRVNEIYNEDEFIHELSLYRSITEEKGID